MKQGAYSNPNDDLNPWILLTLTWFNTQVKPSVEFDGALPSNDIGWIDEIEKVPREGMYKKTHISTGGEV